MAKLYVTEYAQVGFDSLSRSVSCPQEPALVDQTPVVIGAGSLQSAAFGADTKFVRIHADAICSVAFGSNPTATANSQRFAAGQTEFKAVTAGQKVAVITNS